MEGILQCLNTALRPSKTEITVYKEWNVTWKSLDERILIIVPTARALESITDQSKISSGVHLNMEVSITQKQIWIWYFPRVSVFLYQYPLHVPTNLVEPWEVGDKRLPLLHAMVPNGNFRETLE